MTTSTTAALRPTPTTTSFARLGTLAYGVLAYALGVGSLFWLIATTLDLVPYTGGPVSLDSTGAAILFNLLFIALFGLQHAVMARPAFKARWTKIVPPAVERSTFVLAVGLILGPAMLCWQPLAQEIWTVEGPFAIVLGALGALGWGYMLIASFAINHFELFGLQQVWNHFRGHQPPTLPLVSRLMYRFDRHPLMTGILIGLWATPTMRLDHLVLAAGLSCYVLIGVAMEERDLIAKHGDAYRSYRRSTMTIVPSVLGN